MNKDLKFVAIIFFVWRIYLFALGYLGIFLLPFKESFPYIDSTLIPSGLPRWLWQWGNFDGVHYLRIAQNGYESYGSQVFFPLYPILIKIGSIFTGNYFLSAFLISNLAIFLTGIFFFNLVQKNFNASIAKWVIIFLFAFPTSFFFGAIYTESLFLLLLVLSFSTKSFWAIIFGFLGSFTRLIGFFIGPSLVIYRRKLSAFLVGGGLLSYISYLFWHFHNAFLFLSAQDAFRNSRSTSLSTLVFPPQALWRYIKIIFIASPAHYDYWIANVELLSFLFGFFLLLYLTVKKKVPSAFLLFGWLSLLLPTFSGSLSSMPRYIIPIFPLFIGLAMVRSPLTKSIIAGIFVLLLSIFTILFTRGYWIS